MTASSYMQKLLRATLILPESNFPGTSSNTLTLTGYRMSASLKTASGFQSTLDLAIYGMLEVDMNAVTILWSATDSTAFPTEAYLTLEASNDGKAFAQIFEGGFVQAAPDYTSVPNVGLKILAAVGSVPQYAAAAPTSYTGATSIVQIAQYLAGKMGFTLENNGVTGNLSTPYYPGTYMDQFKALCEHANLDFYFDGNTTLAICPKNQPRQGKPVLMLSPQSGLIGYPSIQWGGIHAEALWSPALTLGGLIQITGSTPPGSNGQWQPYAIDHHLESLTPDGEWISRMECQRPPS